jgi:PAS domain S-box-containing protein
MSDEQRHYLEAELLDRLQSERDIFDFLRTSSLDGMWYWNLERPQDEWMSPEFWRLFGVDPATKAHRPDEWQDLIFAEDLERAADNLERHCADPNHPYDQIVRYRHADGSTVWVRCRGLAIRDENGVPIRMLGAHNDVTALKRAERDLARRVEEVEQSHSELTAFTYALSHDIKSPINTLQLVLTEILDELGESAGPDITELANRGLATAERAAHLIDDVLGYAEVVGKSVEMIEPVDLDLMVKEVLDDMAAELAAGPVDVSVAKLPEVMADSMQLRLLVQNLVSNAVKFRRGDVHHRVRLTGGVDTHNWTWLTVEDNGVGIAPEMIDHIFTAFRRLNRRSHFDGTGLGLALCQRVANNHGGRIDVDSQPGEGSTFTLRLPPQAEGDGDDHRR